jgi:uncharacterized protein YndB with AHSA1/START domain
VLRTILTLLGVLLAIIAVVVVVGYALPVAHVAVRDVTLPQPPDRVFAALTDVERYPSWRSDVKSVELLSSSAAPRWREHGSNGDITFERTEVQPPSRIVSRIADTDLAFGGSWTYELKPEGGGTRLTITERGEVYNPLFRFMSRFVFGHTATIEKFLADLEKSMR